MAFFKGIKVVKYVGKLGFRLQKLDEPLKALRASGEMPESLQRAWALSGTEEGKNPPQRPDDQPAIVDNTMWYLFDYMRELEKNAPLLDAQYHDLIAECIGISETLEKFLREESDPKELKKWEKKHGTYEGVTEREKYYASLQEDAGEDAEAAPAENAPAEPADAEPAEAEEPAIEPAPAAEAEPVAVEETPAE